MNSFTGSFFHIFLSIFRKSSGFSNFLRRTFIRIILSFDLVKEKSSNFPAGDGVLFIKYMQNFLENSYFQ